MRPLRALILYILCVFIGGALLAPLLWHLAQFGAQLFPRLAEAPFHRFMDRSFLILALAGLWPFLQALGATSFSEIGLSTASGPSRHLLRGFAVGFGSLAILALLVIIGGGRTLAHDVTVHKILSAILSGLATAIVVGTLEEILFRGGIFGGLRRILAWQFALFISSAVYALVHFLQPADLTGPVHWNSGLILLPAVLHGFVDLRLLLPGFFNLTLVGLLLGLAYQRTRALYFSIGMHAGWIFWLKTYGAFTLAAPTAALWFWGSNKMIDGWLSAVVLVITLICFPVFCPRHKNAPYSIRS
jgi:membrane protease YdiL (CAAX protease family)